MIPDSNKTSKIERRIGTPESVCEPAGREIQNQDSGIRNQGSSPILVIETLEKHFGDVAVLRGVTASVGRGGITAFVGPNGAGKTTLFHAITGDMRPDRGTVLFEGRTLVGKAPWAIARAGIGKMFQDVRIFGELTILENVLLALHDHPGRSLPASLLLAPWRGKQDLDERRRAGEALDLAGVEEPWDRPARLLSFGNQKLLALARLVAGDFKLLLLDEPTAGVATPMAERIAALLKELVRERGASIALIEHNFSFVQQIANHAYLLRAGEIMDSGPVAEVMGKAENREVLIGL
jgi:ABC-type branched-subunit amino acid transport system ATPase component